MAATDKMTIRYVNAALMIKYYIIITGTFDKVFVFTYFAILMHLHSRYIEVIH